MKSCRSPALWLSLVLVAGCGSPDSSLISTASGAPDGQPPPPADAPPPGGTDPNLSAQVRQRFLQAGIRAMPPAPPVSGALYDLGLALMFDKVLSGNRDIACATCHFPDFSTGDGRALPAGTGATGLGPARTDDPRVARNAPPLFNLDLDPEMFWDGRVERARQNATGPAVVTPAGAQVTPAMQAVFAFGPASAQPMFPVGVHDEMLGEPGDNELADAPDLTGVWAGIMARLGDIPAYPPLFEAAYPGVAFEDMNFAYAANAIAAFEVSAFSSRGSPFEHFLAGEDSLTNAELQGADAFLSAGCNHCHGGPALSDFRAHNTALPQIGPGHGDGPSGLEDYGREDVTGPGGPPSRYAFITPSLHDVTLTGPWGHAGQYDTLESFVDHYRDPARALQTYDPTTELDDPTLWDTHFTGGDPAILQDIDPQMNAPGPVQVGPIVTFLHSLEDPAARDLSDTVPDSVPSGLPVQ